VRKRTHGPAARKSCTSENPRSGSGPSESARPEGEEPVEGARNPEDGTCRVRQTRVMRIPPPMSLKGQEPQEGQPDQAWSVRAFRPEPCEGDEACGSCRSVFGPIGRPDGGTPRGRTNDAEEAANQSRRYTVRSAPRGRSTLRGSSPGRRRPGRTAEVIRNPWRCLDGLVCPNHRQEGLPDRKVWQAFAIPGPPASR